MALRQKKSDRRRPAKPRRKGAVGSRQKKPSHKGKVQTRGRSGSGQESAADAWHPGPPIDSEAALTAGLMALREIDPDAVAPMLEIAGTPPLRARPPGLEGLVWIIVSQQISTASAGAIFARLRALLAPMEPAAILAASDDQLRGCGLSAAKIRTLHALCEAIAAGGLDLAALAQCEAGEAHRALTAVKGIGPWTADIFLLFCLGHPDAWPTGDLALQEAARLALGLTRRPDAQELAAIGERWRPWRAIAARLLWAYYRAAKGREGGLPAG